MAPKHRALRLCSLAAVAAAWPTSDELAMVQSTIELSAIQKLQLAESDVVSQLPGGLSMDVPQPNVSMDGLIPSIGNITPLIDSIHLIDDTLNAFRNKTLTQHIFDWSKKFEAAMSENMAQFRKEMKEIADSSIQTPEEAGRKVAEMLLLFGEREKFSNNITADIAAPMNAEINNTMKVEKLVDMGAFTSLLDTVIFNRSMAFVQIVEAHANGTLTEMGASDCENFRQLITLVGVNSKQIKGGLHDAEPVFNQSDEVLLRSPLVIFAADVMPQFMRWGKIIGKMVPEIGQLHLEASEQVIRDSLRLLNEHANCGLDEEAALRGSATASRPLGLSLLLAAFAAAFAWVGH